MSEPLIVKAMEWSDTKLKHKEAAQDECCILSMAAFKAWTCNIPWFGSIGLRAACTHCIYIPVTSDRWQPWQLKRTSTIEASLINMEPSSGFLPALSNEQRRLWLPKSQPATVVIGRMLAATVAIGRML